MNKYIIKLDELLKNRLRDADTQLVSDDLTNLIQALDDLEEFDEEDYLSSISLEKLEKEIKERKDAELARIQSRIWSLDQEKDKITNELTNLNSRLEQLQSEENE